MGQPNDKQMDENTQKTNSDNPSASITTPQSKPQKASRNNIIFALATVAIIALGVLFVYIANNHSDKFEYDENTPIEQTMFDAEAGNSGAQFILACYYYNGMNQAKINPATARHWLEKSAEQKNPLAMYLMAWMEDDVLKTSEQLEKLFPEILKLADNGNAIAQGFVGRYYLTGIGVTPNPEEAIRYYKLAVAQGEVMAHANLADCYLAGKGVSLDPEEGAKLLRAAADRGYGLAQYLLAKCYKLGKGVSQSDEEFLKYLRLSADQGEGLAQTALGECYLNGDCVDKDVDEAIKLFKLAAEKKDSTAMFYLGYCNEEGIGMEKNYSEAFSLYYQAAEMGDPMSHFKLGLCYYHGTGVKKDEETAILYFKKAASLGVEQAKESLEALGITDWQ